jgi:hypothetical protein
MTWFTPTPFPFSKNHRGEKFSGGYRLGDPQVKWFDQFLICPKIFVNRKKEISEESRNL